MEINLQPVWRLRRCVHPSLAAGEGLFIFIILIFIILIAMVACAGGRKGGWFHDGSTNQEPISWHDGPVPGDQGPGDRGLGDQIAAGDLPFGDGSTILSDTLTPDTATPDSQTSPLDLTGNWKGTWVSGAGLGDGTVTATLQHQGTKVSGPMDVSGVSGTLSATLTGTVLKGPVANSYAPLDITLTVHNPDHMSGSYKIGPPPPPLPSVTDSGSVDMTRQP
jgi:hypothetical protein